MAYSNKERKKYMKKIALAVAAIAVFGLGIINLPTLENQRTAHASTMACAMVRGDQTAYGHAAIRYNMASDIKVSLAMPTVSAEVAQSIRQSGGC